jgi:hypothetical protein
MSEWHDNQRITNSNFRKLLQERIKRVKYYFKLAQRGDKVSEKMAGRDAGNRSCRESAGIPTATLVCDGFLGILLFRV